MSCYDNHYVSVKMRNLSVVAMIAVIVIHSVAYTKLPHVSMWNSFVQNLFCSELTRFAVPLFFLMSGYWFSKGRYFRGEEGWKRFAVGKVRSLAVPYVCWCVLATVLAFPLMLVDNQIQGRWLLTNSFLAQPGIFGKLDFIFAFNRFLPGDGPLWYVRQLLILFAVAPLWKLFANRVGAWLLGLLWVMETLVCPRGIVALHLTAMAIGWFPAGIALGVCRLERFAFPRMGAWLLGVSWMLSSCLCALFKVGLISLSAGWYGGLSRVVPISGVAFALWGYEVLHGDRWIFPGHFRQTFFNYCFHVIPGAWFIAAALFIVRKNDFGGFVVFCLSPVVMLLACGMCSHWIKGRWPRFYAILTGGRG